VTKIRSQSSDLESAVLLVHHASEDVSSDEGSLDHVGDSSCAGLVLHAGGSILALHEVGVDALHGSHAFGGSDDGLAVVNGRFVEGGTGHGNFLAVGNDDGGDHRSEGLGLLFPFADVLLHELGMSGLFGVTVGLSQSVSGSSDMDVVVSSCTVMFSSVIGGLSCGVYASWRASCVFWRERVSWPCGLCGQLFCGDGQRGHGVWQLSYGHVCGFCERVYERCA